MTVARASTVEIQPPQEEDWARALSAITSAQRIVLACHVNPDGDALGSMLAAALGLRRYGAQVQATFPSPFQLPKMFMTLPGLDLLEPPGKVDPEPEVLLCFDAASAERLGDLTDRMARAREVVVIDHHASNTGFGTIHLVDPRAAATAVVVDELLQRLGVPLDTAIAECLYVALSTDTGSFKYQATSPREHLLAARLLETGIRQDEICRRLFDSRPYGALKLLGEMLDRAVLEPDSAQGVGLVWTYATQDDLSATRARKKRAAQTHWAITLATAEPASPIPTGYTRTGAKSAESRLAPKTYRSGRRVSCTPRIHPLPARVSRMPGAPSAAIRSHRHALAVTFSASCPASASPPASRLVTGSAVT